MLIGMSERSNLGNESAKIKVKKEALWTCLIRKEHWRSRAADKEEEEHAENVHVSQD